MTLSKTLLDDGGFLLSSAHARWAADPCSIASFAVGQLVGAAVASDAAAHAACRTVAAAGPRGHAVHGRHIPQPAADGSARRGTSQPRQVRPRAPRFEPTPEGAGTAKPGARPNTRCGGKRLAYCRSFGPGVRHPCCAAKEGARSLCLRPLPTTSTLSRSSPVRGPSRCVAREWQVWVVRGCGMLVRVVGRGGFRLRAREGERRPALQRAGSRPEHLQCAMSASASPVRTGTFLFPLE